MSLARHFLGYDAPFLRRAAGWMLDRYTDGEVADCSGVLAVAPGARDGHRLLELLVEQAAERGVMLIPPRTLTGGPLPEQLYTPPLPLADAVATKLAWIDALRHAEPDVLARVAPHPPDPADLPAWWTLAEVLEQLHGELAAGALRFAEVPDRAQGLVGFDDAVRWQALAQLQDRYIAALHAAGYADTQHARLDAIAAGDCRCDHDILLLATAEGGRALEQMLRQAANTTDITALIFAPESLADRFNELGWVQEQGWAEAQVPLDEAQVHVVMRPIDQAVAALRVMAGYGGELAAEDITLGVPDAQVVPYLEQQLPGCGVPVRDAAGYPLARTAPVRLLEAVAGYLAEQRHADYAALVRHPDITTWLLDHAADVADIEMYLTWLDEYYNDHLQGRVSHRWLGGERGEGVRRVYEALHDDALLGGLAGSRRLSQWAGVIVELLVSVYGGRTLDRTVPADRAIIEACSAVKDIAEQLEALSEALNPECTAGQAAALVVRAIGQKAMGDRSDEPAVEMLGALSLPLDDAAALILTGFNEGAMPTSVNADPFCPDRLRRHLGLVHNGRRYARDCYALTAMLHSRRRVDLIAGRVSSAGDPLRPSRLLFACDAPTAARRIRHFYGQDPTPTQTFTGPLQPGAAQSITLPPQPVIRAPKVLESMRVTDFRQVLADPYRFALERIVGLGGLDDAAAEMDALAFGNLAHDVLHDFGRHGPGDSTDEREVAAWLTGALASRAERLFGDDPLPAVRVQLAQLDLRLRALAAWQARWVERGWRIADSEVGFTGQAAAIDVDGKPMYLRGRIDRIDRHTETGQWAVFDYKTSDKAQTPDEAHRRGKGNNKRWVDLQLPLYRHLLRDWRDGVGGEVMLGYIVLPRNSAMCGLLAAEWGADDLAAADEAAAEVVRLVRENRFTFDRTRIRRDDAFARLCGVGQIAGEEEAEDEGDDA